MLYLLSACSLLLATSYGYDQLDSITDTLLREVVRGMGSNHLDDYVFPERGFEARRDALLPSIRDQEFLEHSSLFGHQSIEGGAGEGIQRLKPDGSLKNVKVVKTDALPTYCNPPNPCPLGYFADDGCLEDFENTATFSRDYQASQECICDSEHMFNCPGATRENEIDALARSFENEGLTGSSFDRLFQDIEIRGDHKVVAKKFFSHKASKSSNPFLDGEKLPVIAKKAPLPSIK